MKIQRAVLCAACALFCCLPVLAAGVPGIVKDPSGAPIPGARVAAVSRVGVLAERLTDSRGHFEFELSSPESLTLVISADGFESKSIPAAPGPLEVTLHIAARTDFIGVTGSAIDALASQQGTSTSVISRDEIRERNEEQAVDLLRYVPGLVVLQQGQRGTLASVSIRGGDSKYNLVQLDGMPVNSFYYGGIFDFAHVPTDFLDRIEVARGPQSALYGSYANAGVINFVTRSPEQGTTLDLTAEGGSHGERRFGVSGSTLLGGFGLAGSVSRMDFDGPVRNSGYENENVFLSATRKWNRQSLTVRGNYDYNNTGEPGPYGSNPVHLFSKIDTVSHSRNYFSDYQAHYQFDLNPQVRQEVFASFFLNNSPYTSPYGFSFNKDIRALADERTTIGISRNYTTAFGFAYEREEDKNTYIHDGSSRDFPLRRDQQGIYWENRFQFATRLFIDAGVRAEVFEQAAIPGQPGLYSSRPKDIAANTYYKINPKLSAAYAFPEGTRVHSSVGTGIRPPGGSDLAFTTNPVLKPEHTISVDAGVDQSFLSNTASLGATFFYNRYSDQIVGLGGNLATLGSYSTGNLSRSRSGGVETTAEWRPLRWAAIRGTYTHLETAVLSLEGSSVLVQKYYTLGQALPRRAKQSGALVANFHYRQWSADVTGNFRGQTLDVEPNYGVSAGFFRSHGYQNLGFNLNYHAGHGLTLYGNLRNALNQRYEEIYGYPSPLLNFVTGIKWTLPRGGR